MTSTAAEPRPAIDATPEVTRELVGHASGLSFEDLPPEAVAVAKHCLLDWAAVTLAARDEPLVAMLAAQARSEGGHEQATVLATGERMSVSQAVLVNGSAGHALDYDDVLRPLNGHPTVPCAPVVLALAESDQRRGRDVLVAFVAGVETEARVGALMGESHYARGWHATATVGTFGAAAAAAAMLQLDPGQWAHALGIAGTQAAGLKGVFGTMCKPLHAGKAAQNGLLAARLAAQGFTSRPDILDCRQGFAATMSDELHPGAALADLGRRWHTPDTRFKYHAACYGTHPPIEAARSIAARAGFEVDRIERVEVRVAPRCLAVCNIPRPADGLEMKFSLTMTTALALSGADTSALETYCVELAARPDLVALRDKVSVVGTDACARDTAEVVVHSTGGEVRSARADLSQPSRDLAAQGARLEGKFVALAEPRIGRRRAREALGRILRLEEESDVGGLVRLLAAGGD